MNAATSGSVQKRNCCQKVVVTWSLPNIHFLSSQNPYSQMLIGIAGSYKIIKELKSQLNNIQ